MSAEPSHGALVGAALIGIAQERGHVETPLNVDMDVALAGREGGVALDEAEAAAWAMRLLEQVGVRVGSPFKPSEDTFVWITLFRSAYAVLVARVGRKPTLPPPPV